MGKRRFVVLSSVGILLLVFACGETLREDDPLADAGSDAADESPSNETGGSETGSEDGSVSDAPTCDAALLSDPTNCGACGRTCETAACDAGACEPFNVVANWAAVASQNVPIHVVSRDGQLYIADVNQAGAGSGVLRCTEPVEMKPCNAARLFIRPDIREIVMFDASVAYAAPFNATFENFDGGVGMFPVDASGVDAMAKDETIIDARSIALFGNSTVLVATSEGVKRCSGVNGSCKTLTAVGGTTNAEHVVADANGYCYSGVQAGVRGVYCAATLAETPTLRANATTAASPSIALAGDRVVWSDQNKLAIRKRAGVEAEMELASGAVLTATDDVAADDTYVVWTHGNALLRCPLAGCGGGDPTLLAVAEQPAVFRSVAIIGKWIYFGQGLFGQKLLRIPR